jgi:hypothetical protein
MVLVGLAGGSLIFLAVIIVLVIVVAVSYYTYRGSGINPHPRGQRGDAAGAAAPSDPGHGRIPEDPNHPDEDGRISTHGTK